MKRLILIVVLAAGAFSVQAQNLNGKPFIAVQGSASREIAPDTFPVEITLVETGMDAAKAQDLVEGLAKRIMDTVARMKIPDADVSVGNLSVNPEMKYDDKTETESFIGNSYERVFKIRFHKLSDLREFLGDLPIGKNVKVETQEFFNSNEREIKRQLRREAIADAKRAAQEMADAVGKRLGALHNVSDRSQGVTYSAVGFNSDRIGTVEVLGTGAIRPMSIVLREGVVRITADAYLVYLIAD